MYYLRKMSIPSQFYKSLIQQMNTGSPKSTIYRIFGFTLIPMIDTFLCKNPKILRYCFVRTAAVLFLLLQISSLTFAQGLPGGNYENGKEGRLKAVLIVGPQEDGTGNAIKDMERTANLFQSRGVETVKFYGDDTDWNEIVQESKGAHFLVYSGHGNRDCVLALSRYITNADIITNLRLENNALVIFKSVCYGAGSSAGDDEDIGINEALRRVNAYARTFYQCGARAYYANNFLGGCEIFLTHFFESQTIKDCFLETTKDWTTVETIRPSAFAKESAIGVASDDSKGSCTRTTYVNGVKSVSVIPAVKGYEIAFVAPPDFNLSFLAVKNQ